MFLSQAGLEGPSTSAEGWEPCPCLWVYRHVSDAQGYTQGALVEAQKPFPPPLCLAKAIAACAVCAQPCVSLPRTSASSSEPQLG